MAEMAPQVSEVLEKTLALSTQEPPSNEATHNASPTRVPKGRATIAQRLGAGYASQIRSSPGGTTEFRNSLLGAG